MHSVRSRGGQHTSLSARRDAGFIDPNRLARRRTKPGDAGPSCEGVPTGGIARERRRGGFGENPATAQARSISAVENVAAPDLVESSRLEIVTNLTPNGHDDTACSCPAADADRATVRRAMAAADALVASATRVLDSCSDKTLILPKVVERLYKEFGKDECKAVMQGGAKRWFEQYPLNFRVQT